MGIFNKYYLTFFVTIGFLITGCKEEIDIESIADFEKAIVIEAIITNEFKYQKINLSETFSFEKKTPTSVSNANVSILVDEQNIINFYEINLGKYVSEIKFRAEPNKIYQLLITTATGKSFESIPIKLTNITQIDKLDAFRETNSFGIEGMAISLNSFDPSGNSRYYRYEYEETYKIIAPFWTSTDMVVNDESPYIVEEVYKTEESRTCYNTVNSFNIIQNETTALSEDKIENFLVRFINRDNAILSHRYSILVKQYVQSLEAYTYYKTLNKLSGSDNVFSQNQPGFFSGNIFSNDNPNSKVLGFFEVSSVSSKRIFFNYKNFFPDEARPPYFIECKFGAPDNRVFEAGEKSQLVSTILRGDEIYFSLNNDDPIQEGAGPFYFVTRACGDCTVLGSNIVPDFWEE